MRIAIRAFTHARSIPMTHQRSCFVITTIGLFCICLQFVWRSSHSEHNKFQDQESNPQYFRDLSVHTTKDHSREFGAISHHDARFTTTAQAESLTLQDIRQSLQLLLSSFFDFTDRLGLRHVWIAHGSLLGHHFGQHILPWDTDIDVQMSEDNMSILVHGLYNLTEHKTQPIKRHLTSNQSTSLEGQRQYLLDINSYWTMVSTRDLANKIDARWIDTTNGKFIDITVVHQRFEKLDLGFKDIQLVCKDGHTYQKSSINPLASSQLNGVEVRVPADPWTVLAREYRKNALSNKRFHWHHFDQEEGRWLLDK